MSYNAGLIFVILAYLAVSLFIGLYIGYLQKKESSGGFLKNYFIGGRSMGGFVLAMTLVATYASSSSFLSGPGFSTERGLTQTFVAMTQIGTAFVTLGIIGKKFALVSRKINAVSVSDYMRARYKSNTLVILSSLALVVFFMTNMVAQFIGGAVLFETVSGLPYVYGLFLFGGVVILYSTFGGFKGVVATDTIQGVVMAIGTTLLLVYAIKAGGGMENITSWLDVNRPGWDIVGKGTYQGIDSPGYIISFWVLVGVATLGLPQNAVRGMGFKSTEAMHKAMIYGTVVIGFLMIGMHLGGMLMAPSLPQDGSLPSTDYYVPWFAMNHMPSGLAGLLIAAPLAAVMSTVSSLLILASATIIKDLYINYIMKGKQDDLSPLYQKKLSRFSFVTTFILGIICLIIATSPPDLIMWINLFALGGLEAVFFWPILLGLFWEKANAKGALLSALFGTATFVFFNRVKIAPFGIHEIVLGLIVGGIAFYLGSKFSNEKLDPATRKLFFGK